MTNKEKNILLKNYKRIYHQHLITDYKNDSRLEFVNLLDALGLKTDRYIIENEVISELRQYNNIQREMFEMIFESFLKYGVYIHYDVKDIELFFDNLQFQMNDEEKRLYQVRINNILQYIA